jgi:RHS repeat-associated protein
MSDEGGNVVSEYVYDGWGNLVSSSGSVSQPYEYVGREGYYREGDLYLLGQRWYDSSAGRFISRDPIGEKGGVNLYVYVGNDSMNKVDPIGTNPYLIGRLLACVTCAYLIYDQAKEYWDFYKDLFQECVNKGSTKEKIECYANLLGKILNDQFNPLCKKINIIKDITCTICIGPKLPPPPPLPIEKCPLPCPAQ